MYRSRMEYFLLIVLLSHLYQLYDYWCCWLLSRCAVHVYCSAIQFQKSKHPKLGQTGIFGKCARTAHEQRTLRLIWREQGNDRHDDDDLDADDDNISAHTPLCTLTERSRDGLAFRLGCCSPSRDHVPAAC